MKLKIKNGKHPFGQPDPYIIEDNGNFFIFTTGEDGVHCYQARKITGEYEYLGIVFKRKGYKEYWAPAVIKYKENYFLYVSYMPEHSDDVHEQTLVVASSSRITGPYRYLNNLCLPFSIDAHPVLNESGLYMFYSINNYDDENAGTRIVVDKMLSPTKLEGNPRVAVSPTIKEEIFMKDRFRKGQDWYTIEGACYFYENGIHYLLYSANCYGNEYYFVGYAACESHEKDLTKITFTKQPNEHSYCPLLSKNEFESGTGHNTVIKNNDNWYIVYHGRDLEDINSLQENRTMRIAILDLDGLKLKVIRD